MDPSVQETKSRYFSTRLKFNPKRHLIWRAVTENIQSRFIDQDDTIIDLGCGYGDFINHVHAKRKIAIDLEDVGSYLHDNIEFHCSSVEKLDFLNSNSINAVFGSNLLEHLDKAQIKKTLLEIRRILKPSGKLILIQPNFRLCYKNYFDDYTHQTIFTDESLCGLLMNYDFSIVYKKAGYLPFSMQSRLPKSYWLSRMYLALGSPLFSKQMLIVGVK